MAPRQDRRQAAPFGRWCQIAPKKIVPDSGQLNRLSTSVRPAESLPILGVRRRVGPATCLPLVLGSKGGIPGLPRETAP